MGASNDLGVENLSAAGKIAGETSTAYNEIVTMSMVSARAIGIGAYLVRLGRRVVQVDNSSILLTGALALNKLLGKEVYTSNIQLGGVQIMANNGVSYKTEPSDVAGIARIIRWLSYIPKCKGIPEGVLTVRSMFHDTVDRPVGYRPSPNEAYDPRWLICGRRKPATSGDQEGFEDELGLFDVDSFDEIMGAWAQTVVTGRARLGGIPCGVIAVETRAVEVHLPADPANPESEAKVVSQAGQVS